MAFVRMIFEEWAMRSSEQIGEKGQVVEIDESKFGKRKYNKGERAMGFWKNRKIYRKNLPSSSRKKETEKH